MKRKVYTSRSEKQNDFFIGFLIFAVLLVGTPALIADFAREAWAPLVAFVFPVLFLITAGIYRPWMAIGGLGCIGALIALGLLAAVFLSVVCSTGFR
jgi:hypothetical protein